MDDEHPETRTGPAFTRPDAVMDAESAQSRILEALAKYCPSTPADARVIRDVLARDFPDDRAPDLFRRDAAAKPFREFFVWGHDQDFGHGVARAGAMGARHVEITAEALQYGFLPSDLTGRNILDIGCWSGGDILALSGLGGDVTATEEHPVSAQSAQRLTALLGCPATVLAKSAYRDDPAWRQRFDIVYCSGVLYHVTDPVLLLRICFSYLRPGGRLILETKADTESDGSTCDYSGTAVAGWNFFAPSAAALARWLVDAGFRAGDIRIHTRAMKRFLACAEKRAAARLPESAGFSRPGSWLEGEN